MGQIQDISWVQVFEGGIPGVKIFGQVGEVDSGYKMRIIVDNKKTGDKGDEILDSEPLPKEEAESFVKDFVKELIAPE